ncbi:MAG: hypothetical protein KDK99_09455 [Verrucomicrobiales bacterium]|nr:hypothetical protein [Verrucomicrobiales bacterium]
MTDEATVVYHESNEGRETHQGFAGFEGNNVLLLLAAVGISLVLSQGVDNLGLPVWANILIMALPILLVSAYVFGLKQGKPKSYDIELAEWLIIKLLGLNYFSPRQVEPMKLPWNEPVKPGSMPRSTEPTLTASPPDAQTH